MFRKSIVQQKLTLFHFKTFNTSSLPQCILMQNKIFTLIPSPIIHLIQLILFSTPSRSSSKTVHSFQTFSFRMLNFNQNKIVLRKLFNISRNTFFFSWHHPGILVQNHLLSYIINTRDPLVKNHLLSYTGTRDLLAAGLTADQ